MSENEINIKGSSEVICEFMNCAINNVLFQRGIYPESSFRQVKKYKMRLFQAKEKGLVEYLNNTLYQLRVWLKKGQVNRIILVVTSFRTGEALERWSFNIKTDADSLEGNKVSQKSMRQIANDIRGIILQITAINSNLPYVHDEECSIQLLFDVDGDAPASEKWHDTEELEIENAGDSLNLRPLDTKCHKVTGNVVFKKAEEYEEMA